MANELTVSASLAYEDATGASDSISIEDFVATVAEKLCTGRKVSVGTSEQALNLNGITTPGFILIINRDDTNFVEIRVGTGGAKFCKLKPGEPALFRFGSGATAPYLIADTAACKVEYVLVSN